MKGERTQRDGARLARMEHLDLRIAEPADAAVIRALSREAYAKWVPLIGREPLPMTADYEERMHRHRFDLLFGAGELAALIETVAREDDLLIENVAVRPSFQGRGLGKRLMAHAETLAASLRRNTIRLYTNRRFTENIALYARLGYAIEREEVWPTGVAVHMVKRLGQSSLSA